MGYVHSPSLFAWLKNSYAPGGTSTDDGHGPMIPFLVAGLFWWKRKTLLAPPLQVWWPGIFFLAAGIALHLFGFVVQQPRFSVVGMFAGIFGLMGMAWGRAWLKESVFPFWLFIFSVPLSALLTFVTFPLRLLVTWLVAIIANLLTVHVVRQGTVLLGRTAATNMRWRRRAAGCAAWWRFFCWRRSMASSCSARRAGGCS